MALGFKLPLQIEVLWGKGVGGQKVPHDRWGPGSYYPQEHEMWFCLNVFFSAVFSVRNILWSFGAGVR